MKTETDIAIAERVKSMREKLGISQRRLAVIIGTNYSFVNRVEKPDYPHKYSAHHIHLIAEDFDCEVSELYPPVNKK